MNGKGRSLLVAVSALVILAPSVLAPGDAGAGPTTCDVAPSGAPYGTIDAAIQDAGCDVIRVAPGTYLERLQITRSLELRGAGADRTIVDAEGAGSVVTTPCGAEEILIGGFTLQRGAAPAGGGIENCAVLTIEESRIAHNTATNGQGGGIDNDGELTVRTSTIAGNRAAGVAGAGGGIFNRGRLDLVAVTLASNVAGFRSGAVHLQGGFVSTLDAVTISANTAKDAGGAIVVAGGAEVHISNSTIAGNEVVGGHGAGAIWGVGTVRIRSSVVAGPKADCEGAIESLGHNLDSDGSCFRGGRTDLWSTSPKLAPLADNGGRVRTRALEADSPAVDGASPAGVHCGGTDARGLPRPSHARCDIGSYERATCAGITIDHVGTPLDDRLAGTGERDGILALGGDDVLQGGSGQDGLCAGDGDDAVTGGAGDDMERGGPGDDRLLGGKGNDFIRGEEGRDGIDGGLNMDRCYGGPGRDRIVNCAR
jgi:hypothetical protein